MIQFAGSVLKGCFQVFAFEVRHFFQDLFGSETRRKEIENVNNANTHAANARSTATLVRIDCDSLQQLAISSPL
jgi:hypothetical protein